MGVAVLGPEELRFRTGRTGKEGRDFFLHIRYDDIATLELNAHKESLILTTKSGDEGVIELQIGPLAVDWKQIIQERPDRLSELGVKSNSRVALIAVDDPELESDLKNYVDGFSAEANDGSGEPLDVLFVGIEHKSDFVRFGLAAAQLRKPHGVVWAVYPKVARTAPSVQEITDAARAAGLISTDTVELSRTHWALKLASL